MLTLLLTLLTANAGPWVQSAGEGYSRVGYRLYSSAEGFKSGQATGLRYQAHYGTAYTEWGLPGGLQIVTDIPYVAAMQRSPSGVTYHHNWSGDYRFELDFAVLSQARSTVGVEVRVPTYQRPIQQEGARNISDEDFELLKNNFPEIGDNCVDVTMKWMAGVGGAWGWFGASAGPRIRSNAFKPQMWGSIQSGFWLKPEVASLGLYSEAAVVLPMGNYFNAARNWWYAQLQLTLAAPKSMPGWAVEFGVGGIPVAVNTSKGGDVSVGISYRHRKKGEM
jgi:hypothetical protein